MKEVLKKKYKKTICVHGKRKTRCIKCGGSDFCIHEKRKSRCKQCGGSEICIHQIIKTTCKTCKGGSICEHNNVRSRCRQCKGGSLCIHNKIKINCKDCKGSQICIHNKAKSSCKYCGGSSLCKSRWCEKFKSKKKMYNGYCAYCFVNTFPNSSISRNHKTKEKAVVDSILTTFPNFSWNIDKKVEDGCSKRRPDLLLDLGTHVIIIEIDENQHETYDCSCENKRMMELSQDLSHRPIVFIRFNPDDYTNQYNIQIQSCWKANRKSGILYVPVDKEIEWNTRLEHLKSQINFWIDNPTDKTIEIVHLFYDF